MRIFFKNFYLFSVIFFIAVVLDNSIKQNLDTSYFRQISKIIVVGLLLGYYVVNKPTAVSRFKSNAVIVGLLLFIIGGYFGVLMNNDNTFFLLSFIFFFMGKLCYSYRLARVHDFSMKNIIPFLLLFSLFMFFLFHEIYANLGNKIIIIVVYLFISIILLALSFIRKDFVNLKSFLLVFFGVVFISASESMLAVKLFGSNFVFDGPMLLSLYEVGQYLFVLGLLKEVLVIPVNAVNEAYD